MTELRAIQAVGGKEIPQGTQVMLQGGSPPGHVHVHLKLPGQNTFRDLGHLPVVDGVAYLPLRLVFLCHASEDGQGVAALGERLSQDGLLTWFAPKDLKGGDEWKDRIDDALERSDYVVVFLSQASCTKTGYVQREINYAFEQRELRPEGARYIIPALLEPCEPPRRFRGIHWIRLWEPEGYDRLRESLA